jgi:hypothetical protein
MRMLLALTFVGQLVVAQNKSADKPNATEYNRFSELAKLKATDPKEYEKQMAAIVVDIQMMLARFGYGTRFTGILDPQVR